MAMFHTCFPALGCDITTPYANVGLNNIAYEDELADVYWCDGCSYIIALSTKSGWWVDSVDAICSDGNPPRRLNIEDQTLVTLHTKTEYAEDLEFVEGPFIGAKAFDYNESVFRYDRGGDSSGVSKLAMTNADGTTHALGGDFCDRDADDCLDEFVEGGCTGEKCSDAYMVELGHPTACDSGQGDDEVRSYVGGLTVVSRTSGPFAGTIVESIDFFCRKICKSGANRCR